MALFNNGYPASYAPMYPAYTPVQVQQPDVARVQQPVQGGLIWVQGEAGAKSYLVAPNNTVQLWDSEAQTIYLKSADAAGMPSMKILDYTIRESNRNAPISAPTTTDGNLSNFATKDEIRVVSEQITALRERVDGITKRRRREDEDE
jgi:hypothetical protein